MQEIPQVMMDIEATQVTNFNSVFDHLGIEHETYNILKLIGCIDLFSQTGEPSRNCQEIHQVSMYKDNTTHRICLVFDHLLLQVKSSKTLLHAKWKLHYRN